MRQSRSTVAALLLAAVVGCSSAEKSARRDLPAKPPVETVEPGERQVRAAQTEPDTAEEAPASGLADRMAAYARDVEPQLRQRQARKPAVPSPAPAEPARDDSDVAWVQPDQQKEAPKPQAADATPAENKQYSVVTPGARLRPSDLPLIVPEGEDIPGQLSLTEAAAQDSDRLLQQLAVKVKENPKDLSAQLDLQLLQLVQGKPVPHMPTISGLSAEDREILTATLDALSNFRNAAKTESNPMLSRKIRPLVEMADRLKAQADLSLPNASLCTRVDGFGVYEPITPARFVGQREHPFIIYCEVENFVSQMNDKKLFETRLSHEVVLYTESGLNIWSEKADTIVDQSRNRRRDFYIVKKTRLPANLPFGRYVMKITVTDQQSNRVAENRVELQIVAQ